jgi:NDP-sugar pyrophosphorylase family protein
MYLRHAADTGRFGDCIVQDHRLLKMRKGIDGRPGYINAGIYSMDRRIVDIVPMVGAFSLESDLIPRILDKVSIHVEETRAPFIDIGVPESYKKAQSYIPSIIGAKA